MSTFSWDTLLNFGFFNISYFKQFDFNVTFLLSLGKNQKTIKANLEKIMEPKPSYQELFSGLMNMEFESQALLFLNSISSKWNYLSYSKTEKHCDQIVTH